MSAKKAKLDVAPADNPSTGWGEVPPSPDAAWGVLDCGLGRGSLPPDGIYSGTLNVDQRDKGDVLWMIVDYALDDTAARPRGDLGAIAAKPGSDHEKRVPDGLR